MLKGWSCCHDSDNWNGCDFARQSCSCWEWFRCWRGTIGIRCWSFGWQHGHTTNGVYRSATACLLRAPSAGLRRASAACLCGASLLRAVFLSTPLTRNPLRPVPGAMSVLLPMTVGFGAGVLAWLLMSGDQDHKRLF